MNLDLAALRPAYNGSAAACSILIAPTWAALLTDAATTSGNLAPAGLTLAAVLVGWRLDRTRYTDADGTRHPWWIPRVLILTPATALLMSPAAARAVLTVTTGAAL